MKRRRAAVRRPLARSSARAGCSRINSPLASNRHAPRSSQPARPRATRAKYSPIDLLARRLIRKFRPDVIHTNTALILTPGLAARLANIPHVWHVREFFSEFPSFWKKYQWYMNALRIASCAFRALSPSNSIPRSGGRKVAVIHDGFPQSEFSAADPERVREFRERFNINGTFRRRSRRPNQI